MEAWLAELLLVILVVVLGVLLFSGSSESDARRKFLALAFLGPAAGMLAASLTALYAVILLLQGRFFAVFLAVVVLLLLFGLTMSGWRSAKANYEWIRRERKERIQKLVKNLFFYWPKGVFGWVHQQWRKRTRLKKALGKKKV